MRVEVVDAGGEVVLHAPFHTSFCQSTLVLTSGDLDWGTARFSFPGALRIVG